MKATKAKVSDLERLLKHFKLREQVLLADPFRKMKRGKLAQALEQGDVWEITSSKGLVAFKTTQINRQYKVFETGGTVSTIFEPPFIRIESFAGPLVRTSEAMEILQAMGLVAGADGCLIELPLLTKTRCYQNALAEMGYYLVTSKVTAFADVIGVFVDPFLLNKALFEPTASLSDRTAYSILTDSFKDIERLELYAERIRRRLEDSSIDWKEHYSNYNKAGSWSAVCLRGFGGLVDFEIKPTAMSRKWKEQNPEKLEWECTDTSLMGEFPEVQAISSMIPGKKERIRFMRLSTGKQGGGELRRHTDKGVYLRLGNIARLHIPIITNPDVVFTVWDINGDPVEFQMFEGGLYFLNIQKPHRAINNGTKDRIHLVIDTEVTHELLNWIDEGFVDG